MTSFPRRRSRTIRSIARLFAAEGGATAIEYSILASLISLAIIATVHALGSTIQTTLYDKIASALADM